MSNRRRSRGFSLLELMIVLVIMAAATAVVWPNLQKPLRRTSLTESASLVRELLDDARNQATSRGSAHFVRLETGSNRLYLGTLQQFLEAGSLTNDAGALPVPGPQQDSAFSRSNGGSLSPRLSLLPETVIVSNVRHSIARTQSSSSDSTSVGYSGETGFQSQSAELLLEPSERTDLRNAGPHWLPMLASDLGRDATITLYDTQLQDSIEITYCAATGAIEILP